MNIQLFLENQEVELNNKIAFPLNKTFENLWNPTDIIVEYSKSINVPATAANNKLMANAYRLDRQYIVGRDTNIGMYLDPMKRIPMKLIYNGTILLDGYAKYTSATSNGTSTFYTFNLYGALGDVFQTLSECVVDANKLTDEQRAESDGGKKYVIDCPWTKTLIDKDFIKESWDDTYTTFIPTTNPHRNIGFAPAYRGFYEDFESTSALGLTWNGAFLGKPTETTSIENDLKSQWKINLSNITKEDGSRMYSDDYIDDRVESIDFNMILPIGINEHIMRQFRSYEQKPYIYFYALMKLFQDKCSELTGYTINLDSNWFNINNPYWTRLCYMLDYLSVKGNTLQSSLPFTGYTELKFKEKYCNASASYEITDSNVLSKGKITIDPFTLGLRVITGAIPSTCVNPGEVQINMRHTNYVTIDIAITTGGTTTHKYFWGGTGTPSTTANVGPSTGSPSKYPNDEYIYMTEDTTWDRENNRWVYMGYLTTRPFEIEHNSNDPISITYNVQFGRAYIAGSYEGWSGWYTSTNGQQYSVPVFVYDWGTDKWNNVVNSDRFMFLVPNITYNANWRTNTTCELKNLYAKDEPLFNVILQYTKMFGLIWKPDYNKKTIDIMTRKTYFKDYDVVDWSDKVDKSKGMIIEPVSFSSKYVTFNYDDVEGYRYSGYRNKYGVDYGEKKLKTKYNFDTKEEKLFKEKIGPSSVSCKSFYDIDTLRDWNTVSKLQSTPSEVNFIDCENEDESSAISLNNWYFRVDNFTPTKEYYITDASSAELSDDKYYWLGNEMLQFYGCYLTAQVIPRFTPVFPISEGGSTLGCIFNCPNEDYTNDKKISEAKGHYIYDICWSDYINERYNANNKKLTCYVKISPIEFEQFNFKTFVTIDNQLFVVNKIVDYDVNSDTTKCEFIQVSDMNGYTSQKVEFPQVKYYSNEIYISPTKSTINDNEYVGYGYLEVCCYPSLYEIGEFSIRQVSERTQNSSLECYDWQSEEENSEIGDVTTPINAGRGSLVFRYTSPNIQSEEWEITINALGDTKVIPVYILEN